MEVDKKVEEEGTTPYPPPIVTETLQYRLATGNIGKNGGQRGSLTRCAQKFGTFQSRLRKKQRTNKDDNDDENNNNNMKDGDNDDDDKKNTTNDNVEIAKQELINDLGWYQLEWNKLLLVQQNWNKQVQANNIAQEERLKEIEDLQKEVIDSQTKAQTAQERQNCFMEYEALAKLANDNHATTSRDLELHISKIQTQITDMETQQTDIDRTLKVRETQFHLFLQYMFDLKRQLEDNSNKGDNQDTTKKVPAIQSPVTLKEEKEKIEKKKAEEAKKIAATAAAAVMEVDGEGDGSEEDGLYGDL